MQLNPTWIAPVFAAVMTACALAAEPGAVPTLIRSAGNAESDAARLAILKRLQQRPDLAAPLKADLDRLVPAVEKWVTSTYLPYFSRAIQRDLDLDFGVRRDSPLYPVACLYRARMLVWVTLESGNIIRHRDRRRQFLDKAVAAFKVARKAFPENRIVRMYLGEPIPWTRHLPGADAAPPWAALQRENLERLADIITWWIDHRMQPDGQYGGGWGDDCEMWRWWAPVLIGFDDPKIVGAQARFADALMRQPHMKGGYMSRMTDVEHSAEDSTDVILPMMHLAPDDPVWRNRALRLADLMETLWTGRNARGLLQFKSTYFTVDKVDPNPQRACDTVYHVRAVQPALLCWQRTGEERLGRLFSTWMKTWVDAAARAERGKPAGVIPSAIHWPDGRVGGLGNHWWDPRNHGEPTLYEWPSAARAVCDTLLLTWHMTGDETFLAPLRSMAAMRLRYQKGTHEKTPAPGSEAWCAARLGFLAPTLAKYRRLTGSKAFDDLLGRDYRAHMAMDRGGDSPALAEALRAGAEALRVNWPGYTSEVRWTDRVLRFPALFRDDYLFEKGIDSIRSPNPLLLYTTATGDPGGIGYFPLNAVRWLTPPRDVAALVTDAGTDRFEAHLFHFGETLRPMGAELYLLKPGRYTFEVRAAAKQAAAGAARGDGMDRIAGPTAFEVSGSRTRIRFEIPARRLSVLAVAPDA